MTTWGCARQDDAQRAQRGLHGAHIQDQDSPGKHAAPESEGDSEGAGWGHVEFLPGTLAGGNPTPGPCGDRGETGSQRDRDPETDGRSVPGWTPADRPVRLLSPAQSADCCPHVLSVVLSACPHVALGAPGSWSPREVVVGSPALDRRPRRPGLPIRARPGLVDLVRPLALPPRACLSPLPGGVVCSLLCSGSSQRRPRWPTCPKQPRLCALGSHSRTRER